MAMREGTLSVSDIDALFKRVRISLHILDEPLRFAAEPAPRGTTRWAAKDIVGGKPPRRFLYHGEKAQAFLVATIPNFDQVRWSLATSMKRTQAPELASGDLALSEVEADQFFALLRFSVAAHQAKTVPASGNNSPALQRTPGSDSAGIAALDPSRASNVSRPLKVASMASAASFSAQVPEPRSETLAVDKLDTGAWCCVYPFTMDVPVAADISGQHMDTALMLEVHTTCLNPSNSPSSPYDRLETASDVIDDRTAQLEDLASRLSSEMLAHGGNLHSPRLFDAGLSNIRLDSAAQEPAIARRVVQILVVTRPAVDISTRVVGLPTGFGADAALVEVSVYCDSSATCASGLTVESVHLQSPDWHVEPLAAQAPALPFSLTPGSCWVSVFKASWMSNSARGDTLGGLKLLNSRNPLQSGAVAVGLSDRCAGLSARVCIGSQNAGAAGNSLLEVSHFISIHDQTPVPTVSALSDGATYMHSDADIATDTTTPAGSFPSTRSGRSSDAYMHNHRLTMDARRSMAKDGAAVYNTGHSKTTSLDITTHAQQLPLRKYSLANPPGKPQLSDSALMHAGERMRRPAGKHMSLGVADPGHLLAQRLRAVTINDTRQHQHQAVQLHRPQSPVSTIQSTSTGGYLAPSDRYSSDIDRESLQRRSSIYTAIGAEQQETSDDTKIAIGAIDITFEAPPKTGLGDEILVRVYLANNSSAHFPRLCLVDDPPAALAEALPASAVVTRGLLPVEYATTIPPLQPGGSTFVALKYTAAAPQFHAIGALRLVDLDAASDQTLAIVQAPFVIYVEES
ncbi:hypothetical protein IWW50_002474, partial [Coemansia erecta]